MQERVAAMKARQEAEKARQEGKRAVEGEVAAAVASKQNVIPSKT